jgi:Xaa-Pro aminopeptidase
MREIRAETINPQFNWAPYRCLGVDFEERVDDRRLHRYRLSRVKQTLENASL